MKLRFVSSGFLVLTVFFFLMLIFSPYIYQSRILFLPHLFFIFLVFSFFPFVFLLGRSYFEVSF